MTLGHGEEFQSTLPEAPRGLAEYASDETIMFATDYEARDGFLLTARGNPFGNLVKDGDKAILHSASGLDFEVPVLKQIATDATKMITDMAAVSANFRPRKASS